MDDPDVVTAELEIETDREITAHLDALRHGMRQIRMTPISAVMRGKAPATSVAGVPLPNITGASFAGGLVVDLVGGIGGLRAGNRELRVSSPVAIKVSLENQLQPRGILIQPRGILTKLRHTLRPCSD